MPEPSEAHRRLNVFVGEWHAEGTSYGDGPPVPWVSEESYEWLPGERFLLHRWDAMTGTKPFRGTEVLGFDEKAGGYFTRMFDDSGNHHEYRATVDGNVWRFTEMETRATVTVSDNGQRMEHRWEWRNGGTEWRPLCDRVAARRRAGERTEGHERLSALVGRWRTEGRTIASPDGPTVRIHGTDGYEWLPGRFYLVHRVDVHIGDDKVDAIEIIGYDAGRGDYAMHSFDHRGSSATMRMTERDGVWTAVGEGMRSRLVPDAGGDVMRAHWERPGRDGAWLPWMEISLTRDDGGPRSG